MPPKRDGSAINGNTNNTANNSEIATTTTINNATLAVAMNLHAINTNTTSAAQTLNSSVNSSSIATTAATTVAANSNNPLPVLMQDAAAEQRTIAYQANAKLCRLVRKCPWMYDRNHHNYAKKHILDKSWCKIARECNDSVASCKERWRNIRAAFARSINIYKTHSGPNRVKPYYLHKELSFLVKPMMEGRDKKDDFDDIQEGGGGGVKDEEANAEENEVEEEDDEEEEQAEDEDTDFPDDTADIKSAFEALNPDIRIQTETRYQKMLRTSTNNNNNNNNNSSSSDLDVSSNIFEPQTEFSTASDAETEFHFPDDTLQAQNELDQRNRLGANLMSTPNGYKRPMHLETETFEHKKIKLSQTALSSPHISASENDIKFLEALLPDMALMNTRQKIVFKRKTYQTLEEVFDNSNDFPNIEQCKLEHTKASNNNNNYSYSAACNTNNNGNFNNLNMGCSSMPGGTPQQVRQTVLTVNSSTARTLINNIANLSEAELQRVNGFLQNTLRSPQNTNNRLANVSNMPSTAAAKLMSSTPKITITKVTCPPPAALRSMNVNKPPSPCANTVSTTIHHHTAAAMGSSNVHSTTSSNPTANTQPTAGTTNNNNSLWNQILPITIKDEIEDVDIV